MLNELLGSMPVERFLSEYWSQKPLHVPGTPDRFGGLYDKDSFRRAISAECPASVRLDKLWQERCWQATGKFIELKISNPEELGPALAAGATVTVSVDSNRKIARLASELASELCLTGECRAHAWLSMPAAGIKTHFDASGVLALQLEGKKRWRISPVPVLKFPRFLAVQGPNGEIEYGHVDAHDSDYLGLRMTESELIDVELAPGDALYLPAGTWHGTEVTSSEPSLAISLRLIDRGFVPLAATLIEETFLANPEWRHVPPALLTPANAGEMPPEVFAFFSARLSELRAALERVDAFTLNSIWKRKMAEQGRPPPAEASAPQTELDPQQILAVTEDRMVTYAIGEGADGKRRMNVYCGDKEICLSDERIFEFGVRLIQGGRFRADSTMEWLSGAGYTWLDVRAFLLQLVAIGLLKKVDAVAT